jgi:hypothetical protein
MFCDVALGITHSFCVRQLLFTLYRVSVTSLASRNLDDKKLYKYTYPEAAKKIWSKVDENVQLLTVL